MRVREGLIPAALGTAVTAAGIALRNRRNVNPAIAYSVIGFGLAHLFQGAIDLADERR